MGRAGNSLTIFVDDRQISFSISVTPAFSKQLNFQNESNVAPEVRQDILKWNFQIYVNVVDKIWPMVISFS